MRYYRVVAPKVSLVVDLYDGAKYPMSCFNNRQSSERIIYALFSHQNHRWKDRLSLNLHTI